jgi:cytoskeletal protein RodZ
MTTPRPPRNRFGTTTFVIIVLGALLAVFPATAVLGLLLLLLALVPAVIAYVLTRTGRATDRRRSLASLVLAPVFLIVAAGVVGANAPATPLTVNESPAAVGDTSSLAASPTSTPGAPVAPVVDTPVLDAPAFDGPAVEATGTTRVPQRALAAAPTAKATASRSVATKAPAARASASKTAAAAKTSAPAKSSATKKPSCDTSTHYVNSSGNCVLRPTASPPAPGGASAKCKDGTLSFSQHRSGTCSGHGGVAQWL